MVKDPDARTKVFNWKVPIRVDGRPGQGRGRPVLGVPARRLAAGRRRSPHWRAWCSPAGALVIVVRRRRSCGRLRGEAGRPGEPRRLTDRGDGAGPRAGPGSRRPGRTRWWTSTGRGRGCPQEGSPERVVLRFSGIRGDQLRRRARVRCHGRRVRGLRARRGVPLTPACRARLRPGLAGRPLHGHLPGRVVGLAPSLGRVHVHRRASPAAASAAVGGATCVDSGGAGHGHDTAFRGGASASATRPSRCVVGGRCSSCVVVWAPAPRAAASGDGSWGAAAEAMTARVRRLVVIAAGSGALSAVLGIVLQGADGARAPSFWPAPWTRPACCTTCWPPGFGRGVGRRGWPRSRSLAVALAARPAAARRPALRWLLAAARWPLPDRRPGAVPVTRAPTDRAAAGAQRHRARGRDERVGRRAGDAGVRAARRATRALAPADRTAAAGRRA